MRASDIKVGDVIDGWTVIDVSFISDMFGFGILFLKLEVRVYDAVLSPATKGSGIYITSGVPRTDWYRADEEVEVERADG